MYTFIVNPNARSGLGGKIWNEIEAVLKQRSIPYQVYFTLYRCHATQLARDITSGQDDCTIVILGGDGTVNEVVNGICHYKKTTLGYIPIGSSNDFARFFHLSKEPLKALETVLSPSGFSYMDIGLLNYKNKQKNFAVSTGIGFDAGICHQAVISKLKVFLNKIDLGKLTYAGISLDRLIYLKPKGMSIILDGERKIAFDHVFFTVVMNHPYEGGGFKFCPAADPCDGFLDVMVISGISKLKALLLLPTAFMGKHIHFKGVYNYRCRRIEIESEKALPVHTDGEPVFLQKHMSVSLEPEKLRVITR